MHINCGAPCCDLTTPTNQLTDRQQNSADDLWTCCLVSNYTSAAAESCCNWPPAAAVATTIRCGGKY